MTRAGEVRVTKPLDGPIVVTIARRVAVAVTDHAARVGIGRKLHHAERCDRTWKRVPFAACADERIDICRERIRRLRLCGRKRGGEYGNSENEKAHDQGL